MRNLGVGINICKGYAWCFWIAFLLMGNVFATDFITKWNTANTPGTQVNFLTSGGGYLYDIDWGDGNSLTNQTSAVSHDYASSGIYTITISGSYPAIDWTFQFDLIEIMQWGTIGLTGSGLQDAFTGCTNLATISATDQPDLSTITSLSGMFKDCSTLNSNNLVNWDVSTITSMEGMFNSAVSFDQDLSSWDISNVTDMANMFSGVKLSTSNYEALLINFFNLTVQSGVSFDGGNSSYCDSTVSIFRNLLGILDSWTITDGGKDCSESYFITTWKTNNTGPSGDTQITIPTTGTGYNYTVDWGDGTSDSGLTGDITHTYSSAGTYTVSISGAFPRIAFYTGDDAEKILSVEQWGDQVWTSMESAFSGSSNLMINATDAPVLSSVTDMRFMFQGASSMNQDIGNWDVGNVILMYAMFNNATAFNQDIGSWDVGNVTQMHWMFNGALAFDQDISAWNVGNVVLMSNMFNSGSGLSTANYDALLISWGPQVSTGNYTFHAGNSTYCSAAAQAGRADFVAAGWNITDAGLDCASTYFITTWKTDNFGYSDDNEITIPTKGTGYNYTVNWGDGTPDDVGVTGNITHVYAAIGTYTVTISGDFPRIFFDDDLDVEKIIQVNQWGTGAWTSMANAFDRALNLEVIATDIPDLSGVTDMSRMFRKAGIFNQDISSWDVSNITNMSYMFANATMFNQPLGAWNTSAVTGMRYMFYKANAFNQDIGSWDVSNVTDMASMFRQASVFNQNISGWNTGSVQEMPYMFAETPFDQNIGAWNTASVTTMKYMFNKNSVFNQAIGLWNTSSVQDMAYMFSSATMFNQPLGVWNTSAVTNMRFMFYRANGFNQDIGLWDVSIVTDMANMFQQAYVFDQDLSAWNTGLVLDMSNMFANTPFNGDIGAWNTISVTNMAAMFHNNSVFNQDIGSWNTGAVTDMNTMFKTGGFDQNIGGWDISSVTDMANMFANSTLSIANYDSLLIGWDAQNLQPSVIFHGGNSPYCKGKNARQNMLDSDLWTIDDGGIQCFEIIWNGSAWSGGNGIGGAPSIDPADWIQTIIIQEGTPALILENAIVDSLVMEPGATMEISACLKVNANSVSTNSFTSVVLKANSESEYGQYNGPAMLNTTVEMKLENYGWHQLASPIGNAKMEDLKAITSTAGSGNLIYAASQDVPFGDTSQFRWYETQDYGGENIGYGEDVGYSSAYGTWYGAKATDNFDKKPCLFFVNATATNDTPLPLTISVKGTTNEGSKTTITDVDNFGWNLISNPYTTSIDWESIEGRMFSDPINWKYGNTICIWEPADQNYAIYMAETGTGTNGTNINGGAGVSLSEGARYIAPFQSFWVQRSDFEISNSGVSIPLALTIQPEDRTDCAMPKHFKVGQPDLERVRIQLSNKSNSYTDEMVVNLREDYETSISLKKDALKLPSSNQAVPMIMTRVNNKNLAIHGRAFPDAGLRIPLYTQAKLGEELSINITEIPKKYNVWIEDIETGVSRKLEPNGFDFTNFEEGLSHKFNLVLSTEEKIPAQMAMDIYMQEANMQLEFDGSSDKVIIVSDMLGRIVYQIVVPEGESSLKVNMENWAHQAYLVSIKSMNKTSTYRIIR